MGWMRAIIDEIIGLFVDDLGFAVAILVWLAIVVVAVPQLGLRGFWPVGLLFGGLLVILVESAVRRARQNGR